MRQLRAFLHVRWAACRAALEDLAQESFARAMQAGSLDGGSEGRRRYLLKVANNVCLEWCRERSRRLRREEASVDAHADGTWSLCARGLTAAEWDLARRELLAWATAELGADGEMLVLTRVDGLTYRQAGEVMGWSKQQTGAAQRRIHRFLSDPNRLRSWIP